jgi:hypothetical protein
MGRVASPPRPWNFADWHAVFALVAWEVTIFLRLERSFPMSSVLVDAPSIVFVQVWFRTHNNKGRRLPRHLQAWWYTIIDERNKYFAAPLPLEVSEDCLSAAEAVVKMAERCGLSICVEVVRSVSFLKTATWSLGQEEFCSDES